MKCPFRKRITVVEPIKDMHTKVQIDGGYTTEEFEECYGNECPYYNKSGRQLFGTECMRIIKKV